MQYASAWLGPDGTSSCSSSRPSRKRFSESCEGFNFMPATARSGSVAFSRDLLGSATPDPTGSIMNALARRGAPDGFGR